MENNNYFKMNHSGRSGSITYHRGNNNIDIYWEMSGSPKYDILLSPINLKEWDEPKGLPIPLKEQLQILQELRAWSHKQNMKTDIDLPNNLSFENEVCAWIGCNENRIKDYAYCIMHYDHNLLMK